MTDDVSRYLHPEQIVSTEWLAAHLKDLGLRTFDCTTYLIYETGTGRPYRVQSRRADFDAVHIPGSAFIDLQEELSDNHAKTNFMMLPIEELARRFAAKGARVSSSTRARHSSGRRVYGGCCARSDSTTRRS